MNQFPQSAQDALERKASGIVTALHHAGYLYLGINGREKSVEGAVQIVSRALRGVSDRCGFFGCEICDPRKETVET